jgi:hypothetical protein
MILNHDSEPHRWIEAVQRFVEKSVPPAKQDDKDTIKVALIDDGVDIRNFDGLYYHPGWPYVNPASNDKLYYHSENGHGTIMARMIHMMCPRVRLFVARLGNHDDFKSNTYANKAADVSLIFSLPLNLCILYLLCAFSATYLSNLNLGRCLGH